MPRYHHDKTDDLIGAYWPSDVRERTESFIREQRTNEELTREQRKARKVADALKVYERRKNSYGRFLRKGLIPAGEKRAKLCDSFTVSIPFALSDKIRAVAADARQPISKMIVVLAQLGLPMWDEYRRQLMMEEEVEHVPILVRTIVERSLIPKARKAHSSVYKKWHDVTETRLAIEAERLKKVRESKKSATDKTIEHFLGESH